MLSSLKQMEFMDDVTDIIKLDVCLVASSTQQ